MGDRVEGAETARSSSQYRDKWLRSPWALGVAGASLCCQALSHPCTHKQGLTLSTGGRAHSPHCNSSIPGISQNSAPNPALPAQSQTGGRRGFLVKLGHPLNPGSEISGAGPG